MPKSLDDLRVEYRALAKKKRAILRQMEAMLKGKRITAADDVKRNEVISKKKKTFIVGQYTLSGDTDYGDIHVCFRGKGRFGRRETFYRRFDEVIIDDDPLQELLKVGPQ